jgi:hypothetical protein
MASTILEVLARLLLPYSIWDTLHMDFEGLFSLGNSVYFVVVLLLQEKCPSRICMYNAGSNSSLNANAERML